MSENEIANLVEVFLEHLAGASVDQQRIFLIQFGKQVSHETMVRAHRFAIGAAYSIGNMNYES